MERDFVDEFEDKLRAIEKQLEEAGASICSIQDGIASWNAINKALPYIQEAIHNAYKMRKW